MNPRRLQATGIVLGVALFVATGLLVLTGTDRAGQTAPDKPAAPPPLSDAGLASAQALGDAFVHVAGRVRPCVVSVHSAKVLRFRSPDWPLPFGEDFPFRFFFDNDREPRRQPPREREFRQSGLGSGIIIDKDGHILTNFHVVNDVDEIKVTLSDRRTFEAKVVGADPSTDLAVIKITRDVPSDLPVAVLGDSDAIRVGDWVLAIGAPFGLEQTVTAGIISAKGRTSIDDDTSKYEDFLQTDAAINPGNSGGPLVNLRGEVIGINTAIASRVGQYSGVGFAIPINMARGITPTLIEGGTVSRGRLGVVIQNLDEDLARQFGLPDTRGALVSQVEQDSAADRAGIKAGDVIVRYQGTRVEDTRQLRNRVAATSPGTKAEIIVIRNGKERACTAQIGELTAARVAGSDEDETATAESFGLTVEPLTAEKARELDFKGERGVVITTVEDDSPAGSAGLRPGELITEINRRPVTGIDEYRDALAKAKDTDSVLLLVKSQAGTRFVILKRR
jgi:serine protease Do